MLWGNFFFRTEIRNRFHQISRGGARTVSQYGRSGKLILNDQGKGVFL
jgi:hypothetical protein